ncbi:SH3 domain-containing protein [Phototrophicus methaneseepsis]|uniref:SH3 domain-containing protein n=1 Tax=Phototrophicus methaneseepsis TaxID=2710758 RepID=A0A7S8EB06_9CHLR|nr:SH3 domain-containing protein [Phototrophicus methaneseepsis]QPC83665.1 SH3 domain-containing protein [Phototrophicus methaneseepsis]
MIKKLRLIPLFVLLIFGATVAVAQDDVDIEPEACMALVEQAYSVTQDACEATGRDEACYGNIRLDATPDSLNFEQTGDLVNVADIESLRLSSMNIDNEEWGVSLLRLRANLPEEDTTQNVELLLFGNVEISQDVDSIDTAAETAPPVTIDITAGNNINVRSTASTSGAVIGVVDGGATVTANARNEAGDWVRINIAEEDATPEYGWVFVSLFTVDGDVNTLSVAAPEDTVIEEQTSDPVYGPMQAFLFTSGGEDRPCDEAPDSGLMIQTPDGAGAIDFLVNEVAISLGSTAYLQAVPSDVMTVSLVEGSAVVSVGNDSVMVTAGTQAIIPLDASGIAAGAPTVQAYADASVDALPLQLLEIGQLEPSIRIVRTNYGGEQGPDIIGLDACDASITATVEPETLATYIDFVATAGTTLTVSTSGGGTVGGRWSAMEDLGLVESRGNFIIIRASSIPDPDFAVYDITVGSGSDKTLSVTFPFNVVEGTLYVGASNLGMSEVSGGPGGGTYLFDGFPFTITCS